MVHTRRYLAAAAAVAALTPAVVAGPASGTQPVTDAAHGTGVSCTADPADGFLQVDAFFAPSGELVGPGGVVEHDDLAAWV